MAVFMRSLVFNQTKGLMVTCTFYRDPGLLVKMVSTIDVFSGGRAYLSIGAGWFDREAKGLGFMFLSLRERFERFGKILQIAKQMWAGNVNAFTGKYYQLTEPINSPQPLSQPQPPILIGDGGEKKTLRLVAQYANACNFVIGTQLEEVGFLKRSYQDGLVYLHRKLLILKQNRKNVGCSYSDIEKTVATYVRLYENKSLEEKI
jgi:hypothetical protein